LTLERFQGRYCDRRAILKSHPTALSAGQLASLSGISTDSLRHYERVGVLPKPSRTPAGYRQYPPEAAKRVRMIRRALTIGFTLRELSSILRVREKGGAPCREVRALAAEKLAELDRRLNELAALRDRLANLLGDWDTRLGRVPPGTRAGLLEALGEIQ
jgi:DNA-binding transcriptional MerR regulator